LKGIRFGLTWIKLEGIGLIVYSSAAAEKNDERMALKFLARVEDIPD